MKNIVTLMVLCAVTLFAGDITVSIVGIESDSGVVRIGLYNQKRTFPEWGRAYKRTTIPARRGEIVCKFKNLPVGTYAVSVFHDKDENGELDKKFWGKSGEVCGFSNNPKSHKRAPHFIEAEFVHRMSDTVEIRLHR